MFCIRNEQQNGLNSCFIFDDAICIFVYRLLFFGSVMACDDIAFAIFHTRAHAQIIGTGFPARNLSSTALDSAFAEKVPPRLFARRAREWLKASSL